MGGGSGIVLCDYLDLYKVRACLQIIHGLCQAERS